MIHQLKEVYKHHKALYIFYLKAASGLKVLMYEYMYLVRYMSNIVVENIEEADENSILIFNDFTVSDIDAMIKKKVKGFAFNPCTLI